MVFLHISQTPLSEYKNGGGTIYKGSSRPSGLWYGHDLSWVNYMDEKGSWSPQISRSDIPVLDVYTHIFGNKRLLPPQEGDEFKTMSVRPYYVYALPIPDDAFQPPSYTGDTSKKIMKLTADTLNEFIEIHAPARKEWYATQAQYAISDPLGTALMRHTMWKADKTGEIQPSASYIDMLKYLIPTSVFNKDKKTRAQKIIDGSKAVPLIDLRSSPDISKEIVTGVFEGKIPPNTPEIRMIEDLFWVSVTQKIQNTWGGMDFADAFFTPGHEEWFIKFPTLHYISAGSGVLFRPVDILGKADPTKDVRAVISWDTPAAGPNYVFRLTTKGVVRILSAPKGGSRKSRRKTRRSKTRRRA